jgi:hypothetical protein
MAGTVKMMIGSHFGKEASLASKAAEFAPSALPSMKANTLTV